MKAAGIVLAVLVVELILVVVFVHSGLYNVAVTSPDPRPLRWLLGTTSDHSIEHYSKGIPVPALSDSSMIAEGFSHYDEMCVGCHGAPGVERSEIGKGLYPHGPNLSHSAKEMPPAQLFWIAKNGIKSTGMPAFGITHSDQKIWAIVAFMETLPNMTPGQYGEWRRKTAGKENDEMNEMPAQHPRTRK